MPRWLLPENISDVLPLEARRVEELRRALLDLYRSYGYELVIPPLIEYLDSLLTGTGSDLELRMFKLTDQASGRMMGLRADASPQVARIDAHILNRSGVARPFYVLSQSLTKHVVDAVGLATVVQALVSGGGDGLRQATGRTGENWKREWLRAIGAPKLASARPSSSP